MIPPLYANGAATIRERLGLAAHAYVARELAGGPGRQVIGYGFYEGGGLAGPTLVGKFYTDDAGERTFAVMCDLVAALRVRPGLLAVPAPLFYDERHRLLAMETAPGEPLAIGARGPHAGAVLRRVGRALAELHRLPAPAGPTLGLEEHLADLVRPHPADLARIAPEYAGLAADLLVALRESVALAAPVTAPVHRDFHLRQLFDGEGRIWLIDWDLFAAGDPALDVGNFCVYLRTHLGDAAPAAVAAFLEGYAADGGEASIRRAAPYAAFTYLRLACKAARIGRPGWPAATRDLLEAGLSVLREGRIDA